MTRFNRPTGPIPARATGGALTVGINPGRRIAAPVTNHQGGQGYTRDTKSDVFLIAATSHDITADAFYEGGSQRVTRFVDLIRTVAVEDPAWTGEFLAWLRGPGNIRTAAIVGAIEAARAMVANGIPGGRAIVASVLQRADEPGEAIAYHLAVHGRNLPKAIKRGIADAVVRLYNERNLLKYDTATHAVRFGDVLELTHPTPTVGHPDMPGYRQADLFRYAIDRRHNRDNGVPDSLTMIRRNADTRRIIADGDPWALYEADRLNAAGMTWEDALSLAGPSANKTKLWEALIPSMGFMARLRNLRNFDAAGVPDTALTDVFAMLTDPDRIAKSRQLPLRFLSAHRAVSNLRWAYPLEQALDLSVRNIPALPGRTLILIDTSGSMGERLSQKSELLRWDAAVSFGLALARRCESAGVVSYSAANGFYGRTDRLTPGRAWVQFPQIPGESLLSAITRWKNDGYFIGGCTDTLSTIRETYSPDVHRVILLTDEQDGGYHTGNPGDYLPADTPLYTWNLAGYAYSNTPTTNRYRITLGGLQDSMFSLIPTIESGGVSGWPWEGQAQQAVNNAQAIR